MPKLKINGSEIDVQPGTSILQAAEMLGYEIPRFCYHDRLTVPANCRMCLVEVKGAPKPVASCAMACGDNMEVTTDSAMVKRARQGVMEMLLINHPLDCPICDQGGECDLQDQAVGYGYDRSRYDENKRAVKDKNIGPLIKTVMTRCIHCTRCVRFGEEIGGVAELGLLNRGEDVEIGTFIEKSVSTELSGNMIDICPVGALTSKPYAFQARPWELRKTESIDVMDAVGSNIRVDARGNEVMRILPRVHEGVNEEWISDRTRFAYDGLKRQRLDRVFVRDDVTKRLRPSSWEEAFTVITKKLQGLAPEQVAGMTGDLCALEDMYAMKQFFESQGYVGRVNGLMNGLTIDTRARAGYIMNSGIASIEQADKILLVGTNPRWEAAMVNARIRKAFVNNRVKIGVIGEVADLNYEVTHLGNAIQDLETCEFLKNAQRPMMIVGSGVFERGDGLHVHVALRRFAESNKIVREDWNGFNVLHRHAAQVGALDLQLHAQIDFNAVKFVWLMGRDDSDVANISADSFVVYQGHHGDVGASRADVVLPSAAYTEKDGLYINTEGRVQLAKRAVSPPGEAREDWKIFRALSEIMNKPLAFDTVFQLRQALQKEYPHLAKIDMIEPHPWAKFGEEGAVQNAPLKNPLTNFYLTNVIARASKTMAECSVAFASSSSSTDLKKAG